MPIENLLTKIIVNTNKLPYDKQKELLEITQNWLSEAALSNTESNSKPDLHGIEKQGTEKTENSPPPRPYPTASDDQPHEIYSTTHSNTATTKDELIVNIIEERAYERKNLTIPIDFVSSGQLYKEFTKDLSAGGLFIRTKKQNKFKKNQKISMVFVLSEDKKPFKLTGKILRIEADGIAVQFHNISPFECVAIEEELNNPSE